MLALKRRRKVLQRMSKLTLALLVGYYVCMYTRFHMHEVALSPLLLGDARLGHSLRRRLDLEVTRAAATNDTLATTQPVVVLHSKCYCQQEVVYVRKLTDTYRVRIRRSSSSSNNAAQKTNKNNDNHSDDDTDDNAASYSHQYELTHEQLESAVLTCDLYNSLRRGPNQNVVSLSYDDQRLLHSAHNAPELSERVRRISAHYSKWLIRVYYERSRVNQSFVCESQCGGRPHANDKKNEPPLPLFDNVDFCAVDELPARFLLSDELQSGSQSSTDPLVVRSQDEARGVRHMLAETWHWLPIGDDFVDIFVSRSVRSCMFDREVVAVNEWITSNELFHIMRDHPKHTSYMPNGLWGYFNGRNRVVARDILSIITDRYLAGWYQSYGSSSAAAEYLLETFVWPLARFNAIIHDAYHCVSLQGNRPFPTQRPPFPNCYVGSEICCDTSQQRAFLVSDSPHQPQLHECPFSCKPNNHKYDWIYC